MTITANKTKLRRYLEDLGFPDDFTITIPTEGEYIKPMMENAINKGVNIPYERFVEIYKETTKPKYIKSMIFFQAAKVYQKTHVASTEALYDKYECYYNVEHVSGLTYRVSLNMLGIAAKKAGKE